jgi:hypothetical protein
MILEFIEALPQQKYRKTTKEDVEYDKKNYIVEVFLNSEKLEKNFFWGGGGFEPVEAGAYDS